MYLYCYFCNGFDLTKSSHFPEFIMLILTQCYTPLMQTPDFSFPKSSLDFFFNPIVHFFSFVQAKVEKSRLKRFKKSVSKRFRSFGRRFAKTFTCCFPSQRRVIPTEA